MDCDVCLELKPNHVIICVKGHGLCTDCAPKVHGCFCGSRALRIGRSGAFVRNYPFEGAVEHSQQVEKELRETKEELERERAKYDELQFNHACLLSTHEDMMKDLEAPGRKR